MIGTTGLQGLQLECIVGIYQHEREANQPVVMDIEVDYDFSAPAHSDAIGDAVDYDHITALVTALLQKHKFWLLETMAERISALLLEKVPKILTIRLTVHKPNAVPSAQCSFVRLERQRK